MKKLILLFLVVSCFALQNTQAQDVNYSEHIAPIIYENCTTCHRDGEIGPMALTNYEEVSGWASMIQYVTEIRYMPPWPPSQDYTTFLAERGLQEEEIQMIKDWVAAGSPQGDPNLEPELPDFPSGSQLGTPDLVLEMPEPYIIDGNNLDDYRVFVLPTGLTEDKDIAAVEFRPGNGKAVHHALIGYETGGAGAAEDALSPDIPGYEGFGGFGVPIDGNFLGYTPGIQTIKLDHGIGTTLPANSDILVQVHYAPLPTTQTDQSLVNIFYKTEPVTRPLERMSISPLNLPGGWGSFQLPANEVTVFDAPRSVFKDISLVSVYPHCHLLGQSWEIYAITPTEDTINIIKIEDWDFNWQGAYIFKNLKKIPAFSTIHAIATYDNTENNPLNPSSPPEHSAWGEGTKDEMILVGFRYVDYQPGDEDIELGTEVTNIENDFLTTGNKLYPPYPNPAHNEVALGFALAKGAAISIQIIDAEGRMIKNVVDSAFYASGIHQLKLQTDDLPQGIYFVNYKGDDFNLSQKLSIVK